MGMARTLLDYFGSEQTKPLPKEEVKAEAPPSPAKNNEEMKQEEAKQLEKEKTYRFSASGA